MAMALVRRGVFCKSCVAGCSSRRCPCCRDGRLCGNDCWCENCSNINIFNGKPRSGNPLKPIQLQSREVPVNKGAVDEDTVSSSQSQPLPSPDLNPSFAEPFLVPDLQKLVILEVFADIRDTDAYFFAGTLALVSSFWMNTTYRLYTLGEIARLGVEPALNFIDKTRVTSQDLIDHTRVSIQRKRVKIIQSLLDWCREAAVPASKFENFLELSADSGNSTIFQLCLESFKASKGTLCSNLCPTVLRHIALSPGNEEITKLFLQACVAENEEYARNNLPQQFATVLLSESANSRATIYQNLHRICKFDMAMNTFLFDFFMMHKPFPKFGPVFEKMLDIGVLKFTSEHFIKLYQIFGEEKFCIYFIGRESKYRGCFSLEELTRFLSSTLIPSSGDLSRLYLSWIAGSDSDNDKQAIFGACLMQRRISLAQTILAVSFDRNRNDGKFLPNVVALGDPELVKCYLADQSFKILPSLAKSCLSCAVTNNYHGVLEILAADHRFGPYLNDPYLCEYADIAGFDSIKTILTRKRVVVEKVSKKPK